MKRSEKQLLMLGTTLLVLVLLIRVLPMAVNYYRSGREEIALLQERVERYRTLIVDTAQWQQREQLKTAEVTDLQTWVFPGSDPNLVSSSIQRSLRQLMADNSVELREAGVARYSYVGKWLMVEQDMTFAINQPAVLPFLRALEASRPRLQVSAISISRNRKQYTGSLTVVGFARTGKTDAAPKVGQPAAAASAVTGLQR